MRHAAFLAGVLLTAAPPFIHAADPRAEARFLLNFTLEETRDQVAAKMGNPVQIADFGSDYLVWQFQVDIQDRHDFSHTFCFERATAKLVSVTRNSEEENVDALFPPGETEVHYWPNPDRPEYSVRVRRLPGARLLVAIGSSAPGQTTSQLILIRRSALKFFMPWLVQRLQN